MVCPKWVNYMVCEFYVNKAIFKAEEAGGVDRCRGAEEEVFPAPHARKEALGLGPGGALRSEGRAPRPRGSLGPPPERGVTAFGASRPTSMLRVTFRTCRQPRDPA